MRTKFQQLLTILIVSLVLIVGATQRFDKVIAKSIITTSSNGITLNGSGTLDLSSGDMTLASGDLGITAGNLVIGNGTPTFTQTGEDAYIEGAVEMASDVILGAQTTFSVVMSLPITPTGFYQPLTSADETSPSLVSPIAAPADDTIGKLLLLHNINATQVITIDGTGTTVECKADVVLGAQDTLTLLWNGDDWICISNYDNS